MTAKKLLLCLLAIGLAGAFSIAACGGGTGSCVVPSPTGHDGWESCYDNYTESECSDYDSEATYSSSSCSDRGYTQQCSGEYGYRLPSYSC